MSSQYETSFRSGPPISLAPNFGNPHFAHTTASNSIMTLDRRNTNTMKGALIYYNGRVIDRASLTGINFTPRLMDTNVYSNLGNDYTNRKTTHANRFIRGKIRVDTVQDLETLRRGFHNENKDDKAFLAYYMSHVYDPKNLLTEITTFGDGEVQFKKSTEELEAEKAGERANVESENADNAEVSSEGHEQRLLNVNIPSLSDNKEFMARYENLKNPASLSTTEQPKTTTSSLSTPGDAPKAQGLSETAPYTSPAAVNDGEETVWHDASETLPPKTDTAPETSPVTDTEDKESQPAAKKRRCDPNDIKTVGCILDVALEATTKKEFEKAFNKLGSRQKEGYDPSSNLIASKQFIIDKFLKAVEGATGPTKTIESLLNHYKLTTKEDLIAKLRVMAANPSIEQGAVRQAVKQAYRRKRKKNKNRG